jgi:hypothetical protein
VIYCDCRVVQLVPFVVGLAIELFEGQCYEQL